MIIDTFDSDGSMGLAVYTGSAVGSLTLVTNDANTPGEVIHLQRRRRHKLAAAVLPGHLPALRRTLLTFNSRKSASVRRRLQGVLPGFGYSGCGAWGGGTGEPGGRADGPEAPGDMGMGWSGGRPRRGAPGIGSLGGGSGLCSMRSSISSIRRTFDE